MGSMWDEVEWLANEKKNFSGTTKKVRQKLGDLKIFLRIFLHQIFSASATLIVFPFIAHQQLIFFSSLLRLASISAEKSSRDENT